MSSLIVPRYYQEDAEFSIFDYFASGKKGNPIVAMPTGTGKSIVIANFIKKIFSIWPNQRLMMLTHVKELIEQNAKKLLEVWPTAPIGIYSAGLNSRDFVMPVIFGGVQSVAPTIKKASEFDTRPFHLRHFGWRDLLIIDECHLLSEKEDSYYQFIISELKLINPNLKVIGFSATPYRMKTGLLTEGGLFNDICYDITGFEAFNRLIAEGFISPLYGKKTINEIDVSNVGITAGEFNQKQLEVESDKDEKVFNIVKEIMEIASDRKAWLIFATGIKNTEHVASVIQSYGIDVLPVHSKLPEKTNTERLNAFRAGELRGLVNGQKLTTGFDHPPIDFIGDLNPTLSPGKHVQKYGRGTRPSPETGKVNCLIGDFGGNIKRLGPINDPRIPNRAGKGTGEMPVKICEVCGIYNHASARICVCCGTMFEIKSKLFETAAEVEPLRSDAPIVEYFDVRQVIYNLHEKKDASGTLLKPPTIKVSYFCGLQMFNEWVCLEHPGLASKKARDWWRLRHNEEPPATTRWALQKVSELRTPKKIKVWINKKYPEILSTEF